MSAVVVLLLIATACNCVAAWHNARESRRLQEIATRVAVSLDRRSFRRQL